MGEDMLQLIKSFHQKPGSARLQAASLLGKQGKFISTMRLLAKRKQKSSIFDTIQTLKLQEEKRIDTIIEAFTALYANELQGFNYMIIQLVECVDIVLLVILFTILSNSI